MVDNTGKGFLNSLFLPQYNVNKLAFVTPYHQPVAYPSPPPLRGEFPTLIRHLRPSALDGRFKLAAYLRVFICRFYGGK